mmetsp:Transcript_15397/g.35157  ORF Transcript_15397/g.35157 Transcript_15397/m.35157 type:complete len:632 (+) Transcript_15397:89-1984(+)
MGDYVDPELEAQAQALAEKALANVPETVRAAKIETVKQGILKRLKAQASGTAPAPPQAAPAISSAASGQPPPPVGAPPVVLGGPAAAAPPPPPPAQEEVVLEKLPGIESCGDEGWFADLKIRRLLRESVVAAHAEQKILVGAPAEEIRRICPSGGRVLMAGAVLRLGGATLGGYGEADINYAYRQLSRALHPDKNPDIPEAPDAFRRLSEAADELRQALNEARNVLRTMVQAMGGTATPEMLERPQEALFAEASRMLSAIVGLSGEGNAPDEALRRALVSFSGSSSYHSANAQVLLAEWFENPTLLEFFASTTLRTAYDCTPKRFRAEFLCLLNRVTLVEAKRNQDCIRGSWQAIMMQFPELAMWREFRDKLTSRVWSADGEADDAEPKKRSKWDDKSPSTSKWATKWRDIMRKMFPRSLDSALSCTDKEVRQLGAMLWAEVVTWARSEADLERHLQLFTGEASSRLKAAQGADADEEPAEWGYVPASDIFLVVGDGIVGLTCEGIFAENPPGHDRITLDEALHGPKKRGRSRSGKGGKDRKEDGNDDKKKDDFNWEEAWRAKVSAQKRRGGSGREGGSSGWAKDASQERSRSRRARSRSRRRRSRSRRRRKSRSRSEPERLRRRRSDRSP